MIANLARQHIAANEGLRFRVYKDTKGLPTIGYGFNLTTSSARGICKQVGIDYDNLMAGAINLTQAQANSIFEFQLEEVAVEAAQTFPDLTSYPQNVVIVICDLIFNLGHAGFLAFHHFIADIKARRFALAANDLQHSLWFTQVGKRGPKNVDLLLAVAHA